MQPPEKTLLHTVFNALHAETDFTKFKNAVQEWANNAKGAAPSASYRIASGLNDLLHAPIPADHRAAAAAAIGLIGTPAAEMFLLKAADDRALLGWPIAQGIIRGLGNLNSRAATKLLFMLAQDGGLDKGAREVALEIARRHIRKAIDAELPKTAQPYPQFPSRHGGI